MVLKKSNSTLNSGATQRVRAKEAARQAHLRAASMPEYCLVLAPAAPLTPTPSDDKFYMRRRQQAMSMGQALVLDFFNQGEPMLNDHGVAITASFAHTCHEGNIFPVHKNMADNFPATVDRLKKDVQFARELSQFIDLQVHTFSGHPLMPEPRIQRSKWSSFDLATSETSPVEETCKKNQPIVPNKGKKTKTAKSRGVQRQSQLTAPQKTRHQSKETKARPEWILYAEVSYPDQKGARGAGVNPFVKRGTTSSQSVVSKQTSKKLKSRDDNDAITHGMSTDCGDWYSQGQLLHDEMYDDLLAYREDCDQEESTLDMHEGSDINERHTSVYNLLDFCQSKPLAKTLKRRRRKSSLQGPQDGNDMANSSIKQSEGFIVYGVPVCNDDNPRSLRDQSDTGETHSDDEYTVYTFIREPKLPFSGKIPCQEKVDKVFHYSDPSLISVNIANVQIEQDSCLQRGGYSVEFGNCSPNCFQLSFHDTRELWISKYAVLGRQYEDHWMLSLVDTTLRTGRCSRKLNDFLRNLLDSYTEVRGLDQLVHIAKRAFLRFEPICLEGAGKKAKLGQMEPPNELFKDPVDYTICSPEEAFKLLSSRPHFSLVKDTDSEEIDSDSKSQDECCVCYLAADDLEVGNTLLMLQPCFHTFCLVCWRQHVYHNLREGRVDIGCLVNLCKTKANAAMMQSLLSNFVKQHWWNLLRDKQLELSPASAWCSECDKVVVLEDEASVGCPVSCRCGKRFCHSCGDQPHWPSTCEQFRAYYDTLVGGSVSQSPDAPFQEVVVRPCPNCKYPVQKHGGCDYTYCPICHKEFRWSHCKNVKGTVLNRMIIIGEDEDVLCFVNCGKIRRVIERLGHQHVRVWLKRLRTYNTVGIQSGFSKCEKLRIRQSTNEKIKNILEFLKLASSVIEGAYLYIGNLKHFFYSDSIKLDDVTHVDRLLARLTPVVYTLDIKVLHQSFGMLYKSRVRIDYLLQSGKTKLAQVVEIIKKWERLPDHDTDLTWLEEVNEKAWFEKAEVF